MLMGGSDPTCRTECEFGYLLGGRWIPIVMIGAQIGYLNAKLTKKLLPYGSR